MGASPSSTGYNIPVSLATASSAQTNPLLDDATYIVFGNASGFATDESPENDNPTTATVAASEADQQPPKCQHRRQLVLLPVVWPDQHLPPVS